MSGERRLKECGVGEGSFNEWAKFLLLRRRRRAHLPSHEERLVPAIFAIRHLQRLLEWIEEEGQVDSQSLRQDSAIGRR